MKTMQERWKRRKVFQDVSGNDSRYNSKTIFARDKSELRAIMRS